MPVDTKDILEALGRITVILDDLDRDGKTDREKINRLYALIDRMDDVENLCESGNAKKIFGTGN